MCCDEAEFQSLLQSEGFANFLIDCGYCKPICNISLSDKDDILRMVTLHYLLFRISQETEQFVKGLKETLNFGYIMQV